MLRVTALYMGCVPACQPASMPGEQDYGGMLWLLLLLRRRLSRVSGLDQDTVNGHSAVSRHINHPLKLAVRQCLGEAFCSKCNDLHLLRLWVGGRRLLKRLHRIVEAGCFECGGHRRLAP